MFAYLTLVGVAFDIELYYEVIELTLCCWVYLFIPWGCDAHYFELSERGRQ